MAEFGLTKVAGADRASNRSEESLPAHTGRLRMGDSILSVRSATPDSDADKAVISHLDDWYNEDDGKGSSPDGRRNDQRAPWLLGRVHKASDLELKAKTTRTPGNRKAHRFLTAGIFAVAGAGIVGGGMLGGFVTGAAAGGLATLASGPGAIVGAIVGGLIGAFGTAYLGKTIIEWQSSTPQAHHLKQATESLETRDGGFTKGEKNKLEAVSDDDWRTLLHIPSSKLFGSGQVKGWDNRQAIRQDLVECIANGTSVDEAKAYKEQRIRLHNAQAGAALRAGLGLEPDDLPDNIRDRIDRLVEAQKGAPDLEQQVGKLLIEQAAERALASSNLPRQSRVVSAIVAHAARHTTDPSRFLQDSYAGRQALRQLLEQQESYALQHEISSRMEAVAKRLRRTSLLPDGVAARVQPGELSLRAKDAIDHLDKMMKIIVRTHDDGEPAAVSYGQQTLLRAMAESARREAGGRGLGGPDALARAAVRAGFVHGYLVPRLSELAEGIGKTNDADASLAYDNRLVAHAFGRNIGRTFDQREQPDEARANAWNAAQDSVRAAVEGWYDRADAFLDLIASDPAQEVRR